MNSISFCYPGFYSKKVLFKGCPAQIMSENVLEYKNYQNVGGIYIFPKGSRSVYTDLDTPIFTTDLLQYIALIIIDKNKQKHYMAHININTPSSKIASDLRKNFGNNYEDWKNLEIFLVKGEEKETQATVNNVLNSLRLINDNIPGKVIIIDNPEWDYFTVSDKGSIYKSDKPLNDLPYEPTVIR